MQFLGRSSKLSLTEVFLKNPGTTFDRKRERMFSRRVAAESTMKNSGKEMNSGKTFFGNPG